MPHVCSARPYVVTKVFGSKFDNLLALSIHGMIIDADIGSAAAMQIFTELRSIAAMAASLTFLFNKANIKTGPATVCARACVSMDVCARARV